MNTGGSCESVDDHPFLTFLDLTCHIKDTGAGVFWLHCAA